MSNQTSTPDDDLALHGGAPAVRHRLPPMYPGGMRIGREEEAAVLDVLRSRRLFRYYGPEEGPSRVAGLEQVFAERMGTSHAVAVASGTIALCAALAALGVGPGDEVIVPAYTWIATAAAVTAVGAVPVIAEVDESLTLDPRDVEAKVTPRTRAIIPVHMRGAPADMDSLQAVAGRHGLALLEDTAQALGGSYHGRRLGTIGRMGAFSLQFNKILTSGEGGVVVTGDQTLYERALMYHDVAASQRSKLDAKDTFVGITARMSELQGAVALVQLERLDSILVSMRRQKMAIKGAVADLAQAKEVEFRRLNDEEGDTGLALIFYTPNAGQARHVASVLDAEGAQAHVMFDRGRSDYHVAYHWTPIMDGRSWASSPVSRVRYDREMWPRTLDLLGRAVHLNVSPELTDQQAEEVVDALRKTLRTL